MPRPRKSQTGKMDRPPKIQEIETLVKSSGSIVPVTKPEPKVFEKPIKKFPQYDQLRIPVSALDWQSAGKFLRSDGIRDREIEKQFNELLGKGYRVKQWQVEGASVYIFFEQG